MTLGWRCILFGMGKSTTAFDDLLAQLKDILPLLRERYHVRTLEVFGSYVRGEEQESSDLDLLVTFSVVPSLFQFVEIENYISDELGVRVELVMRDSLKPAIGRQILNEVQPV